MAKLALEMPLEALLGMYSAVGLGEMSGLDLLGETIGIFPNRRRWSQFEIATLSFGYGLAITPIQLAHAYATLGNHGKYKPIHIIKGDQHGETRQVVDPKYVNQVLEFLETVTQPGGTATRAAVPGIVLRPNPVHHVKRLRAVIVMNILLIPQDNSGDRSKNFSGGHGH